MSACLPAAFKSSQRCPSGIQNTPSAVYSSRSFSTEAFAASVGMKYSEDSSSMRRASSSRRTWNVSDTYFRKIRPSTTCL